MDELTTMVTLVQHESPEQAQRWFDALCEVYDEVAASGDPWAEFRERLPGMASTWSFDEDAARRFVDGVEQATGDPAGWMAQLSQSRGELAAWYAYATAPEKVDAWADQEEFGAEARFAWLTADAGLQARVEHTFSYQPEHYEEYLAPYLDSVWGTGWESHPAEYKQAWLGQLLTGLEAGPGEVEDAQPEPVEDMLVEHAQDVQVEDSDAQGEIAQAVADALAEVPDAIDLPEEVIERLVAEVLEEQAAAAAK